MAVWPYKLYTSQYPQVNGRGRVEELKKSNRGTRGTREAKQEHMIGTTEDKRCTTEEHEMNNRGSREVQQRPYTELRIHNIN